MKRIFIFISFLLISIFTIFSIIQKKEVINFSKYSAVDITSVSKSAATRSTLEELLNKVAQENDSLIAKRIVEPNNDEKQIFKYTVFGDKNQKLPIELSEATDKAASQSDVIASYLIVSGELTTSKLSKDLKSIGYQATEVEKPPFSSLLFGTLTNEAAFLGLIVLILTFMGISMIIRIKDLRYSGIRLISGESLSFLIIKAISADFLEIMVSFCICAVVGLATLNLLLLSSSVFIYILIFTLLIYSSVLLLVSIFLSTIYIIGLKKAHLMNLIKGKIPTKKMIAVMLFGQFLALVLIGLMVGRSIHYINNYTDQQQANTSWSKYSDFYQLSLSFGEVAYLNNEDANNKHLEELAGLAKDAIKNREAIFVSKVFNEQDNSQVDYMYVTPNYLDFENININQESKNKLNKLKQGEYGLLLPKSTEKNVNNLKTTYANIMENFASETLDIRSKKLFKFNEPILNFVDDNQKRFLFNTSAESSQYTQNPVIIVVSPETFSNNLPSSVFWGSNSASSVFYKGYESTVDLLNNHGLYKNISYINNLHSTYLKNVQNLKIQTISLITGSIVTIITCIILFGSMNLLYFEQFRREIFVKKISGCSFLEIHKEYLFYEVITLIISFSIMTQILNNLILFCVVLFLAIIILSIILLLQLKHEEKTSMKILKGK